jgi:hypothetical protein
VLSFDQMPSHIEKIADCDSSFGQEALDIPVTQVESVVEPDGVGNDVRRESVAFVSIHEPILSIPGS